MAQAGPVQHHFHSQRLRLAYWEWGSADAPPLLLLHGKRDHARSLDRLAVAFRGDYRVIAPDLRGHGDSDWAVGGYYGMSEHIADLLALIDVVGEPVDIVGHSFGSRIALYAAGAFPERVHSVVAIEATVNFAFRGLSRRPLSEPEALRRWIARHEGYAEMQPRVYKTFDEARERIQLVDSHLDDAWALELARHALRPVEGGYIWKFDPFARGRTSDEIDVETVRGFWAAVECPVLHLLGGASTWSTTPPAPEDKAAFRDARWVIVPEAGHWLHHDAPDVAIRETRAFLARHGRAGGGEDGAG
ncbi:MAG: alpha/beta hydrolase [Chloroflexi bacterium]|nr:alpha/beta hydrolase [Chloroflexota bacterium]